MTQLDEAFSVKAVITYFEGQGFVARKSHPEDVTCWTQSGEKVWIIEAKGITKSTSTDVQTGIGQLIQRMQDPALHYGLAIPWTKPCMRQCRMIPDWVREKLRIFILLVQPDGSVQVIDPQQELPASP